GGDGPLQAKDVARELGLDTVPAKVEPVRGKLSPAPAPSGEFLGTPTYRFDERSVSTLYRLC
ncbi:hypothetical protein ACH4J0_42150, partial [Kitasatospora sp. NPDC017646]